MGHARSATGLGSKYDFDPAKVITDWSKPLLEGGLGPGSASQNLIHMLQISSAAYGINLSTPFEKFSEKTQDFLLNGEPGRGGKTGFHGIFGYLKQNLEESTSEGYRDWLMDHMSATECPACHGKRLRPESLAVKVNGMSIADFTRCQWRGRWRWHRHQAGRPRGARLPGASCMKSSSGCSF